MYPNWLFLDFSFDRQGSEWRRKRGIEERTGGWGDRIVGKGGPVTIE